MKGLPPQSSTNINAEAAMSMDLFSAVSKSQWIVSTVQQQKRKESKKPHSICCDDPNLSGGCTILDNW